MIKVEQFCSIATSPAWQAWLYHFSNDIYKKFIKQLQKSRNCNENRELMREVLKNIEEADGSSQLYEFLEEQYPHVLKHNSRYVGRTDIDKYGVFPGYVPGILTYPRRKIFEGSTESLKKKVEQFVSSKGVSDYIIIGNHAYVEFLENKETSIANEIPSNNWLIQKYRDNSSV